MFLGVEFILGVGVGDENCVDIGYLFVRRVLYVVFIIIL